MQGITTGVFAVAFTMLLAQAQEQQTIQKSFPGVRRIEVDNVFGAIRVTAHDRNEAEITVRQTIRADNAEAMTAARNEVRLDISQPGESARFYVDGPFRCNCGDGRGGWGRRGSRGYEVVYDFEIKAPRSAEIWLRTVNQGEIAVDGVSGNFDVANVNGGIELRNVSGSGQAHTVNGPVKAMFLKNPAGTTSFKSINGELDLVFQPGLGADLRLKTFNGKIYSDFEVDALPARPLAAERSNGKQIFRADRFTGARIGAG